MINSDDNSTPAVGAADGAVDQRGSAPAAESISFSGVLFLTLGTSLAVMLTFESLKQGLKPDIGIWTSHLITIIFSSVVTTVCAYFALRRYEWMRSEMAQENALRFRAEEALERFSLKSLELERSKSALEREVAERCAAELALIQHQRQLGILIQASRQLNAVLDSSAVLKTLIHSAVELTGASGGCAGLVQGRALRISEFLKKGEFLRVDKNFLPGEGIVGQVLSRREALTGLAGGCSDDLLAGWGVLPDSLLAVPVLSSSGEVLGYFEVYATDGARSFDRGDATLLQGLASSAAVALENALMLSERLEARQATVAANSLLSATIESTLDGIMAVDPHGEISACNSRFVEMWGIGAEALASGDSNKLLLSLLEQVRDPALFFEKVTELYWQPDLESYDLVELTDGRCFERFSKPQFIGDQAVGRVWTFHDISELKKLETQLLHAHKMEAIGTLAGGVAHDFNNIMTAIIGYTSLLVTELDPPAPYSGFLDSINNASNRAVALIQNLLAYSRKDPVQACKLECNALVRDLMSFLERLIGADIELTMSLSEEPQGVLADQGQIEQVLVNLATNARDAMPEGGKLTLEVSRVELSADFVKAHDSVLAGPYVLITVSDTGSGIDEATRQRIFEPFFTTKEVGQGTGLGLSISYGIVQQHGGFVSVASRLGKGTVFSVYLPRVEPGEAISPSVPCVPTAPRGEETVLLLEDNDSVRSLISQVMTSKGYRVIEAVDGQDGVEKFIRHRDEIALVILDVIMPRKNGGDAFDEIRALKGDVRAIFISGYTGDIIDRQRISEDGANFLMKPILPEKLLTLVREVLDK
jgi:two-component system, cell cycle sensor histidine kinase and response regulator CckA